MTTLQKLENTLVPSLLAGAVGAGAFYLMYGDSGVSAVPFGPLDVPVWAAIGASVAVGNAAGEILTQFVLPLIPKNEMFQKYEETVVPPAISGLATYGVLKLLVSGDTEISAALLGAGASIGGKYVYAMI